MTCQATDACNPHVAFMPFVEGFASIHNAIGGGLLGIAVMQFGLWLILYVALVNAVALVTRHSVARWSAGVSSYLLTGCMTLALTFYAITPAMNVLGVVYLSAIWPLWIYCGVGIP